MDRPKQSWRRENLTNHSRFCVSGLPKERRYESWRESIACIFDVGRTRTQAQTEDFHATMDTYVLGPMILVHTKTAAQQWRRSALTTARDGMDHYMVQIYAQGTQRCDWDGGSVHMPEGGFLVYDLSREMEAEATDLANITLFLPRPMLEGLLTAPDDQHMRAIDGAHPMAALFRSHLTNLWRQADVLEDGQARHVAPATAQLLAACLNGSQPLNAEQRAAVDQTVLAATRRDIDRRLADPALSPDDLCRRHRISRSRLYRLFESQGGVAAYIRGRRLAAAMTALVDPAQAHRPVGMIGEHLGFSSPADFSRAFQRRYGLSPRAARHYGARPKAEGTSEGLDRRYERWLHELNA